MTYWDLLVAVVCLCCVQAEYRNNATLCQLEKQKAMISLYVNPNGPIFVPRCDSDGLHKQIQCNDYTGMCWCVDEVNGNPIQGTKTRGIPNCNDPPGDQEVCPGKSTYRLCSPLMCAWSSCATKSDIDAVCRVNPCGDQCVPEHYIITNSTVLDCKSESTKCVRARDLATKYIIQRDKQLYYQLLLKWFSDKPSEMESHMSTVMPEPTAETGGSSGVATKSTRPWTTSRGQRTTSTATTVRQQPPRITSRSSRMMSSPTTVRPHPPINYAPADRVQSVTVPKCTPEGDYKLKQTHDQYSWCVDIDGVFVDGTMTEGGLVCNTEGRDDFNSPGSLLACDNGVTPEPCPSACVNDPCNYPERSLTCKADPCNRCKVTFYNTVGEEVSCFDNNCDWIPKNSWFYDKDDGSCSNNLQGGDCNGLLLYSSKLECTRHHSVNAAIQKECLTACYERTCRYDPYSVCVVDVMSCEPYFVNIRTGSQTDCEQISGICEGHKDKEYYNQFGMDGKPHTNMLMACDEDGSYSPTQCSMKDNQKRCWCVEKNGNMIPESLFELEVYQTLHCEQSQPIAMRGSLLLSGDFNDIGNKPRFVETVHNELSLVMNIPKSQLTITDVQSGSVIIDYTVSLSISDPTGSARIMALLDRFTAMVSNGGYVITISSKEFTAKSNSYSLVYAKPPTTTAGKVAEGDDNGDGTEDIKPGYIALIFVGVLLVIAITVGLVKCVQHREKQKQKVLWRDYKAFLSNMAVTSPHGGTTSNGKMS